MEQVIITSKTHMSNAACIGALSVNGELLRLLDASGDNQPTDTDFQIRQVWEIEYRRKRQITSPHTEDVEVISKEYKGMLKKEITMTQIVKRYGATIWRGAPDVLYDGYILWTDAGSGYISREGEIPNKSVGFWIPDRTLRKKIFHDRVRYEYPNINGWRSLPYVGFEEAVNIIPAGTLVRVSLARWWDREGQTDPKCFLQLSGCYDLENQKPPPPPPPPQTDNGPDDLPF